MLQKIVDLDHMFDLSPVKSAGQIRRSSSLSRSRKVLIILLLRYLCNIVNWLKLWFVYPGCRIFCSGFSMGSTTFGFVRSSFFNCSENRERCIIP